MHSITAGYQTQSDFEKGFMKKMGFLARLVVVVIKMVFLVFKAGLSPDPGQDEAWLQAGGGRRRQTFGSRTQEST